MIHCADYESGTVLSFGASELNTINMVPDLTQLTDSYVFSLIVLRT